MLKQINPEIEKLVIKAKQLARREFKERVEHNARLILEQHPSLECVTLVGAEVSNDDGGTDKYIRSNFEWADGFTSEWKTEKEIQSALEPHRILKDELPYSYDGEYDSEIVTVSRSDSGPAIEWHWVE